MNFNSILHRIFKSGNSIFLVMLVCIVQQVQGQEINCNLTVSSTMTGNNVDPKVFKTLERSLVDFINSRKWTDENSANYCRT